MRHDQKTHLARDVAELLVLPGGGGAGDEEQHVPRQPDLEEHLEIQNTEQARVDFLVFFYCSQRSCLGIYIRIFVEWLDRYHFFVICFTIYALEIPFIHLSFSI